MTPEEMETEIKVLRAALTRLIVMLGSSAGSPISVNDAAELLDEINALEAAQS